MKVLWELIPGISYFIIIIIFLQTSDKLCKRRQRLQILVFVCLIVYQPIMKAVHGVDANEFALFFVIGGRCQSGTQIPNIFRQWSFAGMGLSFLERSIVGNANANFATERHPRRVLLLLLLLLLLACVPDGGGQSPNVVRIDFAQGRSLRAGMPTPVPRDKGIRVLDQGHQVGDGRIMQGY